LCERKEKRFTKVLLLFGGWVASGKEKGHLDVHLDDRSEVGHKKKGMREGKRKGKRNSACSVPGKIGEHTPRFLRRRTKEKRKERTETPAHGLSREKNLKGGKRRKDFFGQKSTRFPVWEVKIPISKERGSHL